MKYRVGDKFILEIQDVRNEEDHEYPYETEIDYNSEGELDKLPMLVNGVDTYSYNKGAEDAWELMKRINEPRTMPENLEMFRALGVSEFCQVFELLTPQEAKAKFDEWKKAKEEIKQGDCVKSCGSITGIITKDSVKDDESKCYVMWSDGSTGIRDKRHLKRINNNSAIHDLKAIFEKISG